MNEQIFYCKAQGVRVPVRLEIFKHGGDVYLAISNQAENINIPFFGPAPAMVARLREAADLIEAAAVEKDQGHISRKENGVTKSKGGIAARVEGLGSAQRLNPRAPNWDWLTPEMVIEYFEQTQAVRYIASDVRAALKPLIGTTQVTTPIAPSQLELDLETVRPYLDRIISNGKVNKSEIARALGIKPSGPLAWARLTELAEIISSSSSDGPRSDEIGPIHLSEAA